MLQIVALTTVQTPIAVNTLVLILATALPNQRGVANNPYFRLPSLMDDHNTLPTASAGREGHL